MHTALKGAADLKCLHRSSALFSEASISSLQPVLVGSCDVCVKEGSPLSYKRGGGSPQLSWQAANDHPVVARAQVQTLVMCNVPQAAACPSTELMGTTQPSVAGRSDSSKGGSEDESVRDTT